MFMTASTLSLQTEVGISMLILQRGTWCRDADQPKVTLVSPSSSKHLTLAQETGYLIRIH